MNSEIKKLIIVGGGGHAKVVIDAAISMNTFAIAGVVDTKIASDEKILGIPVLGNDTVLEKREMWRHALAMGVGMQKAGNQREKLFQRLKGLDYQFPVIRHARSHIAQGVKLSEGCQVMAGAIIQTDANVGCGVIVNSNAVVEHDCQLEAYVHIAPGAVLGGNVSVGQGSLVGLGACILPGIHIGQQATIGAGTVVCKNVADGMTVRGIPAM
jgi:sugar O-acyltransferase (sialic acid O-acetyltransferase NeuD family)